MNSAPKLLFIDIETAPNLAWVWGHWEQNVIAYQKEWHLLSVAWKWNDQKVQCLSIFDFNSKDDKELSKHIHKLFLEADVIVAHNGNQFDIKKCRARFLYHNLPPVKQLTTIDTKLVAKRYFSFNSNSLDDLGRHLGLGRKVKHSGFDLWLGCMNGNPKSWAEMVRYNKMDVELLYRVYQRLLPYIENHPNLALMNGKEGCPNCGHPELKSEGIRYTATRRYRRLCCKKCFAWTKGAIVK